MADDVSIIEAATAVATPVAIEPSAAVQKHPSGFWEWLTRAWRPCAAWTCILVMLTRGVVVPIAEITLHLPVDPIDWTAFAALIGVLGLGAMRSFDKAAGTTV